MGHHYVRRVASGVRDNDGNFRPIVWVEDVAEDGTVSWTSPNDEHARRRRAACYHENADAHRVAAAAKKNPRRVTNDAVALLAVEHGWVPGVENAALIWEVNVVRSRLKE